MITLITGHTGGGKTYLAVNEIIKSLNSNRKVYTNIKLNIFDKNYHYLSDEKLKQELEEIGALVSSASSQEDAKELMRNQKNYLFDSLIVIDEAHFMGFRDKSIELNNFLTIHRHLGVDLILITQTSSNIHKIHLDLVHKHFEARPASKRILQNTAFYRVYEPFGSKEFSNYSLKFDEDIIKLYKSGKKEKAINKNVIKAFGFLGVAVAVGLYSFYNLFSSFTDDTPKKDTNKSIHTPKKDTNKSIHTPKKDTNKSIHTPKKDIKKLAATNSNISKDLCFYFLPKKRYRLLLRKKNYIIIEERERDLKVLNYCGYNYNFKSRSLSKFMQKGKK